MNASFQETLASHGIELKRGDCTTLQVNVGLLCNMACRHCHLDAGPHRAGEVMSAETAGAVVKLAAKGGFAVADITGGAPEMVGVLPTLVERLSESCPRVMLRSNLTAIAGIKMRGLLELLTAKKVVIVASLPSTNTSQTDSMRGEGAFAQSLDTLRLLNSLGYGREGSGLELNLVANACGAFLPSSQAAAEKKFRRDLDSLGGIAFNSLFTFANAPLGRFRHWLEASGNLDPYRRKLSESFNPCTVGGLMCRSLVSVSWEGYLYDCDFNQACGIPLGGRRVHVAECLAAPAPGLEIATGDHCYACTAGAGFTCGGSIAA